MEAINNNHTLPITFTEVERSNVGQALHNRILASFHNNNKPWSNLLGPQPVNNSNVNISNNFNRSVNALRPFDYMLTYFNSFIFEWLYCTFNLSFQQRQQKMAWQEQQSTTFNASRRKTWAESSVFHGGFAGEYHDHRCPASGLGGSSGAANTFKYERLSSSGHKLFLPTISN